MNAQTNLAFKSSRAASIAGIAEAMPPAPAASPEPEATPTSVLMISTSAVVLEHFARMTGSDAGTTVSTRNGTLAQVLEDDGIGAFDHDIVVFERRETDDSQQLETLRQIASACAGRTRFMVLTAATLSLAQARALIDAGVEEVIPLSSILPPPPAPQAPAPAPAHKDDSSAERKVQGRIVVVAKTRGGVGATTTAVNLAQALLSEPAKRRKPARSNKVAIIDLDIQNGAVGSFLDVADGGGVIEMLRAGDAPDTTVLRRAMIAHPNGLSVLPAPTEFAPVDAMTAPMLEAMLANLRTRFDYVVVDLPTAILPTLSVLLAKADRLLLVTDTAVTSIRQASRLLTLFTDDNFTLPVEVVVTRQAKPLRLSVSLKEAVAVLGRPFAHWIPQDDRSARTAIDLGKPAAIVATRSAMTKAYRRLADDLIASHSSANTRD